MIFLFFIIFILIFAASGLGYWAYNQYHIGVQSLSNRNVLELASEKDNQLTIEDLCDAFQITRGEARIKLYTMLAQGAFEYSYDNVTLQEIFILSRSVRSRVKRDTMPHNPRKKLRLSDGEIISIAVRSKGKITATALCLKGEISIDEAKNRLNELHEKGVFEIKVTDNGTITYHINDVDLLEDEE